MSCISRVRIRYRDDCSQTIVLMLPLPGDCASSLAQLVLTMRNGESCTPDSVAFYDESSEKIGEFCKRVAKVVER